MSDQPNSLSIPATEESNFSIPDYGLDPADSALADEIVNFDPVADTSGPASMDDQGRVRFPANVPLTALPPHLADPIKAELATAAPEHREALERELVNKALTANSIQLRVQAGAGPHANAYQREVFLQAKERQSLDTEALKIETELAEVVRWEPVTDPRTGAVTQKPVEKVTGERRVRLQERLNEIGYHLAQLTGREGQARLSKALKEAVDQKKAIQQQLAEDAEARELADKMLRDERVNDRAKAYAKNRRNRLGG